MNYNVVHNTYRPIKMFFEIINANGQLEVNIAGNNSKFCRNNRKGVEAGFKQIIGKKLSLMCSCLMQVTSTLWHSLESRECSIIAINTYDR